MAGMANRLADSTSPYLLQHRDNPVDWQEWGPAAFEEARERDVPVLLSVGYAACHWCHVMAHESFEDEEVARAVNADFVAVKVDREERPDIDAVYMAATTALTGHGGWPMTCLLTPDGDPFFAGTYFPRPQFLQLLAGAKDAWTTQRDRVLDSGAHIASRLREISAPTTGRRLDEGALDTAVSQLRGQFDHAAAGFGGAPKFPPSMVLEFLLRHHGRTGSPDALAMAASTCEAMDRGGIYDQLGGGFARYSVDAHWVVPHFEKMLYDNAQLLRVHTHLHRATGDPLARRVALETADFLLRDLRTPEGGFASALDADTDGVEGLTYAWTPAQLVEVLGEEDGARAAALLSVTDQGTFEHGSSTLQLLTDPDDAAWWAATRTRLLEARRQRPQPGCDDKVVTSWNGLAIAAFAEAGRLLGEERYTAAAVAAAETIVGGLLTDPSDVGTSSVDRSFEIEGSSEAGRATVSAPQSFEIEGSIGERADRPATLKRSWKDGRAVGAGVLEDYSHLAEGLLALYETTFDERWFVLARQLADRILARFEDPAGGFFDTADDHERLITRPKDPQDNAVPSGGAMAATVLLRLAAFTGEGRYRDAAERAIGTVAPYMTRYPTGFAQWLVAASFAAGDAVEVAIVGDPSNVATQELLRPVVTEWRPFQVLAVAAPDAAPGSAIALLHDRPPIDGRPTAYVCRDFVCSLPVTTVGRLIDQLASSPAAGAP